MTGAASVGGRDRPRLFVAILLPGAALRRLVRWQQSAFAAVPAVRIVPPANLHVTLAFLGNRPAGDLEAVVVALRNAAGRARRPLLSVERYRETRSVGMLGLDDPNGHATAFAEDLHRGLEESGVYERERRRWLAHVTVLRFRRPPRLAPALPELGPFSPSEAAVYHSVLRPDGAQYEIVESVQLVG